MSINSRLAKLEKHRGVGGPCLRFEHFEVRDYPGENSERDAEADTRPGETCATCAKPKTIIQVVYGLWEKATR